MLHHQHAHVLLDDVLGAVAVMHVEIDDRHALQSPVLERMPRRNRDVVEEAEAHRACVLGMVAGRTHRAESAGHFLLHHQVGRQHAGSGGAQRGLQGTRTHRRIGIEMEDAMLRHAGMNQVDVALRMSQRSRCSISASGAS